MAILFNFSNPTTYSSPILVGNLAQAPGGSVDALPTPTLVGGVPTSSIIELQSTTAGFTPPRMTTTQKLAIVTPTNGMVVFDTTLQVLSVYQNGGWSVGGNPLVATGNLTAAQINGMYAAPIPLVSAPGAGFGLIADSIYLEGVWGTVAFAAGAAIALQYASTVHGAGTNALSTTVPATFLTTFAANQYTTVISADIAVVASANFTNVGLYLSNITQAFTTGTGCSVNYAVTYRIVPMA